MEISAKIIADSVSQTGKRITTLQLCYPRFIHGEVMTHRMFSRNAMSSRAVPVRKMIEQVHNKPAMPIHWGMNQKGMQASEEINKEDKQIVEWIWGMSATHAAADAQHLVDYNIHKQVVNRLLEPFQWMHTVVTATEWDNFFRLRLHEDAQPEIYELARVMHKVMEESQPEELTEGGWHLPYVDNLKVDDNAIIIAGRRLGKYVTKKQLEEKYLETALACSVARCARVSYLNHDQSEPNIDKDLKLAKMLHESGHMSPFEHIAKPMIEDKLADKETHDVLMDGETHVDKDGFVWSGNFKGWVQYRNLV